MVAAVYLVAAGHSSGAGMADNATAVIRVSVSQDCTGTPFFVGEQQGIFQEDGVAITDVGSTAAAQRPMALAMGQIDVLDCDPLTLANLIKSGAKVEAVAQSGDSAGDGDTFKESLHWMVLNGSIYSTFADIANSTTTVRIGVAALDSIDTLQTDSLLRKYNISQDRIKYVIMADQYQSQALQENLIDVAVLQPAYFACANHRLDVRVLAVSSDAFAAGGGMSLLVVRDDFAEQHPDIVSRFITGYKDAERWCNDKRAAAANITAQELGICTGAAHYYSDSGQINVTELQYWIDQMVADGDLQPGQITPTDLCTDQFKAAW